MRLMLSLLILVAMLTHVVAPVFAGTSDTGTAIQNNKSIIYSICSDNSSNIQSKERTVFAQAPKTIAIGKSYYADHPISYNSQTGQQTWMKNKAAGVSMNHEVGNAHNLNQTLEMTSYDGNFHDEFGTVSNSGVQMKVKEDVQEGKVSIGVLKGGMSGNGQPPSATALRNPSLDIEEDYIGDFHIEKNMTIQVPIRDLWLNYGWLPCCSGGYFDVSDYNQRNIGAKSIFDYRR
jgi:hypothetical protein